MTEKPLSKPQDKKLNQDIKSQVKAIAPAPKVENKAPEKTETKTEVENVAKPEVKKEPVKITKKEEAVARGLSLHASKKHCMYISDFIKNKPVDQAIRELQEVVKFKRVIPFRGEIPHRSSLGIMSGRFPINASKQIINVLKALKGNITVNGLDLDKTKIYYASASWASRPAKRGGMRFKRTNLVLKAKEFNSTNKQTDKGDKK